jgi:hypothetical protein
LSVGIKEERENLKISSFQILGTSHTLKPTDISAEDTSG